MILLLYITIRTLTLAQGLRCCVAKMDKILVGSLNVKGMMDYNKRMEVKRFAHIYDIMFLQETHGWRCSTAWLRNFHRKGIFSFYATNARGSAILVSDKCDILDTKGDEGEGRIASALIKIRERKVGICSIYAPNVDSTKESKKEYSDVLEMVDQHLDWIKEETSDMIVGGDFNIIFDKDLDSFSPKPIIHKILVEQWEELSNKYSLSDSYRIHWPEKKVYTYAPIGSNPYNVYNRLDYILVSDSLAGPLENVQHINATPLTDHRLVQCHLNFIGITGKGKGVWRHNDSLLEKLDYVDFIKKTIERAGKMGNSCTNGREKWDFIKYFIAKESRKFATAVAGAKKIEMKEVEQEVAAAEENPTEHKEALLFWSQKLEKLRHDEGRKIMMLSRATIFDEGEKMTASFFRLIKQNYLQSNILSLVRDDGSKMTQEECEREVKQFYTELFKKREVEAIEDTEVMQVIEGMPKLSCAQVEALNREVTHSEIRNVLFKHLHHGKSPGNDGLTVAVYKTFWKEISKEVCESITEGIKAKELSTRQRQSIIRLIEKKGKDTTKIKNWRPISLMNVDTKILAKVIATRLERVIESLVSPQQLGFLRSKNICEGTRLIDYLSTYCEKTRTAGRIICLDQEKAFDSVAHSYIFRLLKELKFPEYFIDLIKTLYAKAESACLNNGKTTRYFPLERGCRQGDPLSPYLFLLCIDPLIRMINQNNHIHGLTVGDTIIKISAYADDITVFARDETDTMELFSTVEKFSKVSGLKVNKTKTEILMLSDSPDPVQYQVEMVKVLGVWFGYGCNREKAIKKNIDEAMRKMENNFKEWNRRDVSLLGRVLVVKAHGLSMIQYLANCSEIPEWARKKFRKAIYQFIWKGIDKVSRICASKRIENGGINMPQIDNVFDAAACQWIRRRRLTKDSRPWMLFFDEDFSKNGGISSINSLRKKRDKAYKAMLPFNTYLKECWQRLHKGAELDTLDFLCQVIWHNRRFEEKEFRGTKMVMLNSVNLIKNGYSVVGDFFDADGRIIEAEAIPAEINMIGRMEWMKAVKFIKEVIKSKGYNVAEQWQQYKGHKLEGEQLILFRDGNGNAFNIETLTQKKILQIKKDVAETQANSCVKKLSLNYDIAQEEISTWFKRIKSTTNNTKIRSFMIRMLNGLLYNNTQLRAFGFNEIDNCTFCQEPKQTTEHMFLYCSRVKRIREKLEVNMRVNYGCKERMYGVDCPAENFILFLFNQYIYRCNHINRIPRYEEFVGQLGLQQKIELVVAKKRKKELLHYTKWDVINSWCL